MCIIAIKPAGVKMISNEIIENMWYNNNDGAGLMYPDAGGVKIKKGYMSLKTFKKALKDLEADVDTTATPIIFHFRIETSGGNIAANTHPFPVTSNLAALQKTQLTTPLGVAHNGIIDIRPRKKYISDTMEYILSQLAPLQTLKKDFYKLEAGKELILNATTSKLAFMDALGHIETVGSFETDNGIIYSNSTYKTYSRFTTSWWENSSYYYKKKTKTTKTTTYKPLMWIDENEAYIIKEGEPVEALDYLIDKDGQLYMYDGVEDGAIRTTGEAYIWTGAPVQFDEDEATLWEIL